MLSDKKLLNAPPPQPPPVWNVDKALPPLPGQDNKQGTPIMPELDHHHHLVSHSTTQPHLACTPEPLLLEHVNLSIPRRPRDIHLAKCFYMRGLSCKRNWAPQLVMGQTVHWGFWVDMGLQQIHVPTIPMDWSQGLGLGGGTNKEGEEPGAGAVPTAQRLDGTVVIGVRSLERLMDDLELIRKEMDGTVFGFAEEVDVEAGKRVRITCPFGNSFLAHPAPRSSLSSTDSSNPTRSHWLNATSDIIGLPCFNINAPKQHSHIDSSYEPLSPNTVSILGLELPCHPSHLQPLYSYWTCLAPCVLTASKLVVKIGTDQHLTFLATPSWIPKIPHETNNPHICIYLSTSTFRSSYEHFQSENLLYHSRKRYTNEQLPKTWDLVDQSGQFRLRDVRNEMGEVVYELEVEVRRKKHRLSPYEECRVLRVDTELELGGKRQGEEEEGGESPVSV